MESKAKLNELDGRVKLLKQALIRPEKDENGHLISDNSIKEAKQIEELLKHGDFLEDVLKECGWEEYQLAHSFFRNLSSDVFESVVFKDEYIMELAKKNPILLYDVMKMNEEKMNDIALMRKCASQDGIRPIFLCYVGKNVQNDYEFISTLIEHVDTYYDDFNKLGLSLIGESDFRYGEWVGLDIQTNRKFWELLNKKIETMNNQTGRGCPLFDIDKELKIAQNKKLEKEKNNGLNSKVSKIKEQTNDLFKSQEENKTLREELDFAKKANSNNNGIGSM